MHKILHIHLIFLLLTLSPSLSIVIDCTYDYYDWRTEASEILTPIVTDYSCIADVKGIIVYKVVTELYGVHAFEKENKDVKIVQISNQNLLKMPRELELFFPNIEGFFINFCNLSSINKEDLQPYKKLKYFSVRNNLFTRIEGNLFQFSPKLQFVSFGYNKIGEIGNLLLDKLNYLQIASFIKNKCIDRIAINDTSAIGQIKKNFVEKCNLK
ncbi:hypothetical protein ACKWTF_005282 [Chironomus riparius]